MVEIENGKSVGYASDNPTVVVKHQLTRRDIVKLVKAYLQYVDNKYGESSGAEARREFSELIGLPPAPLPYSPGPYYVHVPDGVSPPQECKTLREAQDFATLLSAERNEVRIMALVGQRLRHVTSTVEVRGL